MGYNDPVEWPPPKIAMLRETDEAQLNARRRAKFTAFLISEGAALAILLPLLVLGTVRRFSDPTLATTLNVLTIAAAAAVAIIPILFYALASTIPSGDR